MSDLSLSPEDIDILESDCKLEQEELKKHEMEIMLELDSIRRKLRSVSQEMDYLRLLRSASDEDFLTSENIKSVHWCAGGAIFGTLTLRRNRLLCQRAKSLHK